MKDASESLAAQVVAEALRQAGHGPSACAALMREAGEALARLASHDRACRVHAELARRHAERAARCWRP
jgi:TolA-binding protein